MESKTISAGAVIVAAAALAVAASKDSEVKTQLVAASTKVEDVAVAAVARQEVAEKTCQRLWVEVRPNPPALHWLCDGAYLPQAQAWLDGLGADVVEVKLTPRETASGVVFDAQARRGELPARPAPVEEEKEEVKEAAP